MVMPLRRQVRRQHRLLQQPLRGRSSGGGFPATDCPPLCAAGTPSPPTRRRRTRHRPLSGCRRTRVASVAIPLFSSCRPLRSTGVTRLCRYYETIRLLHGRRSAVAGSPTGQAGPMETSQGKVARLPAAAAPTTVLPRLDTGRRVGAHAHPDRPACSGVHFRSVLRFASSFHPTEPRGPAVAVHVRFPPVGVRGGTCTPRLAAMPGARLVATLLDPQGRKGNLIQYHRVSLCPPPLVKRGHFSLRQRKPEGLGQSSEKEIDCSI